jgi:cholesterol transport system auxiliary component
MTKKATGDRRRATGGIGLRFAIAVMPLLAGCTGSLLESDLPPSTSYVLAPVPAAADAIAATRADLSIGRPDVAPGLDTDRIAVLKGRQLDYYRGARWGDRAANVVQSMLVASFEDQGLFRSVTPDRARVAGDYVLDVEVRHFQAEYASDNAAPAAHVMIVGRLIRVVDRQLVGTLVAEARSKAQDNRMRAVIAAFETAAQQVALDLAQKTAAAVAADEQAPRTAKQ